MEADCWGSLQQTVDSCHYLARQSRDFGKRNRSKRSHCCLLESSGILVLVLSG